MIQPVNDQPKPVCVLTAAWNQADRTIECLHSVNGQGYPSFTVVLVDNGSDDNTASRVAAEFPDVEIIHLSHNQGFAGGFNVGLRWAIDNRFPYILLINNDTILAPDCLAELVEFAESQPSAGFVTAKIYYASDRDRIWSVGGRIQPMTLEIVAKGDDQRDQGQWNQPTEIDFAPLCGVLLTDRVLKKVGLLDEQFFVYYEDMDFCHRVRQAGIGLWMVPTARIWHAVASSSGGRDSAVEKYWMAQGSGRYYRKHGRNGNYPVIILFRLASALRTTVRLIFRGQFRTVAAYWVGLGIGWTTGRATKKPPDWVTKSIVTKYR